MPVSDSYKEQYKILHSNNVEIFPGQQTMFLKKYIEKMIKLYNCSNMLDYGCGKGYQYTIHNVHKDWNINITLYDIGVEELSNKPNKIFDLVSSTDVLEHCETEYIPEILKELNDFAKKAVLVSISTRLAKKTLPDGRNAHLTVKPEEWWMAEISKIATKPWLILFEDKNLTKDQRSFNIRSLMISDEDLKTVVED